MPSITALSAGTFSPEAAPEPTGGPAQEPSPPACATRASHGSGHPAVRLAAASRAGRGSW
jgi:hypothetical protein